MLQAVVAVMRKLLDALFAMFRTNQPYDESKLCAADPAVMAVAACARATRKERGFSAPLLERKEVDIKRESIMSRLSEEP